MIYRTYYLSPLGKMLLAADDIGLVGAWFEGQKYFGEFPGHRDFVFEEKENCILKDALRWLDIYFSGQKPDLLPELHLIGTDFQREVWDILLEISYGQTVTYGEIARKIADKRGLKTMSAQAVGSAVGHNRVSVIVPCHRVIGSDGSLTGYAGGLNGKSDCLILNSLILSGQFLNFNQIPLSALLAINSDNCHSFSSVFICQKQNRQKSNCLRCKQREPDSI